MFQAGDSVGMHALVSERDFKAPSASAKAQTSEAHKEKLKPFRYRWATFWFGLTFMGALWTWIPLVAIALTGRTGATLCVIYVVYILTVGWRDVEADKAGFMWPPILKRWSLWKDMAAYFPAKLHKTAELDPTANYIFSMQPHGLCSISAWVSFATDATGFSHLFPGIDVHCLTLEHNFRSPFLREYILLHGLLAVSKRCIKNVLSRGPGQSVLLVPGGAAESLLSAPGTYDTLVGRRKGFVRLALETGASIVPVIAFGEPDVYWTIIPPIGSTAAKILAAIKHHCCFAIPLFWGVGLFGGKGLMARSVPLHTVVGAPIPVPKCPSPSGVWEEMDLKRLTDDVHETYCQVVQELWDAHKEQYAPGRKSDMHILSEYWCDTTAVRK